MCHTKTSSPRLILQSCASVGPGPYGRMPTLSMIVFLLGDLLDHLARSATDATGTHRVGKHLTSRTLHHLPGHGDAVAVAVAGPADEDGVGASNAVFAHLLALLANGCEALPVGLAGLLLQELVDRLLLRVGKRMGSVVVLRFTRCEQRWRGHNWGVGVLP